MTKPDPSRDLSAYLANIRKSATTEGVELMELELASMRLSDSTGKLEASIANMRKTLLSCDALLEELKKQEKIVNDLLASRR